MKWIPCFQGERERGLVEVDPAWYHTFWFRWPLTRRSLHMAGEQNWHLWSEVIRVSDRNLGVGVGLGWVGLGWHKWCQNKNHTPHLPQPDQDPSTGWGSGSSGCRGSSGSSGCWRWWGCSGWHPGPMVQGKEVWNWASWVALSLHLPAFQEQSPLHRTGPYWSGTPFTHSLQLLTLKGKDEF